MIKRDTDENRVPDDVMAKIREDAAFSYKAVANGDDEPATFLAGVTVDAEGNILNLAPLLIIRDGKARLIKSFMHRVGCTFRRIKGYDLNEPIKELIKLTYPEKYGPIHVPDEPTMSVDCDPEVI